MSQRLPNRQTLSISSEVKSKVFGKDPDKPITSLKSSASTSKSKSKQKGTESSAVPDLLNWKELGTFLEGLQKVTPDNPDKGLSSKNPLSQPVVYRICNHCDKPISEAHLGDHIQSCIIAKQQAKDAVMAAKALNESSIANNKKSLINNRKRKLDDTKENTPHSIPSTASGTPAATPAPEEMVKPLTKKQKAAAKSSVTVTTSEKRSKKEVKPKSVAKPKGPVDVEKQCGVPLPNGGYCARSLTCKTHSMGAKRAVPGRSAPYDQLLSAYQRKNQAKIGAAAAAAQQAQDDLMHGSAIPLDEEEETHQVLDGVTRSAPWPLERKVIMPTSIRNSFLKMREMFTGAILPRMTNNPLGPLQGRTAVVDIDKTTEYIFPIRSQHPRAPQAQPMSPQQLQPGIPMQGQAGAQVQGVQQRLQRQQPPSVVPINPAATSVAGSTANQMSAQARVALNKKQLQQQQQAAAQLQAKIQAGTGAPADATAAILQKQQQLDKATGQQLTPQQQQILMQRRQQMLAQQQQQLRQQLPNGTQGTLTPQQQQQQQQLRAKQAAAMLLNAQSIQRQQAAAAAAAAANSSRQGPNGNPGPN